MVAHVSTAEPPVEGSDAGAPVKALQVGRGTGGGGGGGNTVTVEAQVTETPVALVAVRVNVLVAVTGTDFVSSTATVPIDGLTETTNALVVFHLSTTVPPVLGTEVGVAVKASQTGAGTG